MRKNKKIDDHIRLEILNSYLHGTKGKYTIEKEKGTSKGSIRNCLRIFELEDKPLSLYIKDKAVMEDVSSKIGLTL